MKVFRKIIVIFAVTFFVASGSMAQGNKKFNDTIRFGSFIYTESLPNTLFLFSAIKSDDSFDFRKALRSKNIDTIVLASRGGVVKEALNLAGIIFDNKISTYVPQLPGVFGCFSACAFLYLAGDKRLSEGRLGVHQIAYTAEVDSEKYQAGVIQQETQFMSSEIIGFLNQFDTPAWVFERMFESREMYVFSKEENVKLSTGVIDEKQKFQIKSFASHFLSIPIEVCIGSIENVLRTRGIDFLPGTATFTEAGKEVLVEIVDILSLCAQGKIEIIGHTDSQGRELVNLNLSKSRADAVMSFLLENGEFNVTFTTKGLGEKFPIKSNNTEEGRQKNRRIEFRVWTR